MTKTKPIQNIEINDPNYLYAQNDVMLDPVSMDRELTSVSADFTARIEKAQTHDRVAKAGLIGQVVTLGACFFALGNPGSIGWCLGSIALGLGVSIPQAQAAMEIRQSVVVDYNKTKN